jgi:CRISPR-associated endonuclease/helicase Cas3
MILVPAASGGYDERIGWTPQHSQPVSLVAPKVQDGERFQAQRADGQESHEGLSSVQPHGGVASGFEWQTIAVHGREVGRLARHLGETLAPGYSSVLDLAGRWHDVGKVHECFNASISAQDRSDRPGRHDLAKAPSAAWLPVRSLYPMADGTRRTGFRHELASTLALFAVLQRHHPDHPALLGPWRDLLQQAGIRHTGPLAPSCSPTSIEQEILELSADEFDLLAYLVCAHHGKVRVGWHASPVDQGAPDQALRIRGVQEEDVLPSLELADANGGFGNLPSSRMSLDAAGAGLNPSTGRGWTERVLNLLDQHGPFALAWLESLVIAADRRVSRRTDIRDELLHTSVAAQESE